MLEVLSTDQRGHCTATGRPSEVAEMATKPSLAPLQKRLLGGCTTDMVPSGCHRKAYRFAVRYIVSVKA